MTDTQVKYQTMMENQRHNLEMEKLGQGELKLAENKFKHEKFFDAMNYGIHAVGQATKSTSEIVHAMKDAGSFASALFG